MKNDRLDRALNYLGDDLISEAADYVPQRKSKQIWIFKGNTAQRLSSDCVSRFFVRLYKIDAVRLTPFKEILCKMTEKMQASGRQSAKRGLCAVLPKYSAAAACLLAAIVGAFALRTAVQPDTDSVASLENPENSSDIISSVLSSLEPQTPHSASTSKSEQSESTLPVSADSTSTIGSDHFPTNPAISDQLNDPGIVWYNGQGFKGDLETDPPKPGTTVITNRLSSLISENTGAVFAVKVSFALYQDRSERENWKCGDTTIAELRTALKALALEIDAPEAETAKTKELEQLKDKLQLAIYDYYFNKCQNFIETFNANDIGFYFITSSESTQMDDYNYFICFATAEQLDNFICKPTEAFVFDIMPRTNAEYIF